VVAKAGERGVRVTGSELVGLIPLQAMIDAGKYFLHKQKRPSGIPDEEIIKIAVRSLGLDELQPFDPKKKIIEYLLREEEGERLTDRPLARFVADTSTESLAPGGGSVSAAIGAMGAALGGMVANMSVQKSGWEDRWKEFSEWAEKATELYKLMLQCVEEDAEAFMRLNHAMKLPGGDEQEEKFRDESVKAASAEAIKVPLKVMQLSFKSMDVLKAMVETGNPALVTDAGVGAIAARAAVEGGFLSIKINAVNDPDNPDIQGILDQAAQLVHAARDIESEILRITDEKIEGLKQPGF
jgi:glutamate formiminotransferase / formiminotetrahydrofolate cyclodeaminase